MDWVKKAMKHTLLRGSYAARNAIDVYCKLCGDIVWVTRKGTPGVVEYDREWFSDRTPSGKILVARDSGGYPSIVLCPDCYEDLLTGKLSESQILYLLRLLYRSFRTFKR